MYYDTAADEEAARKQLKTVTEKWSGQYPSSQALLKALYLGTFEIAKKWTMPIRNWGKVRGELEIICRLN